MEPINFPDEKIDQTIIMCGEPKPVCSKCSKAVASAAQKALLEYMQQNYEKMHDYLYVTRFDLAQIKKQLEE